MIGRKVRNEENFNKIIPDVKGREYGMTPLNLEYSKNKMNGSPF